MSNLKITDLSSLSQSALDASADFLLAVDVSDTTMSASGTNVKIAPKALISGTINDLIQTWNSGATAFTGFKLNVTDTASDADSSLMDLQVGGSSKFRIKKDGTIYVNGSIFSGGSWGNISGTLSSQTDLQNALDAKLSLSGGTLTGPITGTSQTIEQRNSTNAQRFNLYGTYTDGSNYRRLYISSTTGGAFTIGIEGLGTGASGNTLTIANAVIFGGSITGAQIVTNTNGFQTPIGGNGYAFNSGGYFICSSNGVFKISNWADNDFGRLQLGGTTSSFPAIKRNSTALNFRLADDSADCPITAAAATFSGNISVNSTNLTSASLIFSTTSNPGLSSNANGLLIQHWGSNYHSFNYGIMRSARGAGSTGFAGIAGSPNVAGVDGPDSYFLNTALCTWEMYGVTGSNTNTFRVYQARTDSSNYHRWKVDWSTSTCRFGTERAGTGATGNMELWQNGSAVMSFNSGGKIFLNNRELVFGTWNGGECTLWQSSAFSGILSLVDASSSSTFCHLALGILYFGGTTSSQVRLARSSTTLLVQLANGSAFTNIQGKLTTETNYTAGAPTATGYLILYDATGTAYRVPAVLN